MIDRSQGRPGSRSAGRLVGLAGAALLVAGPKHPDALSTRQNQATVLFQQGRYDEAAGEFQSVLATKVEVLGPNHRDTLRTRRSLAAVLPVQDSSR